MDDDDDDDDVTNVGHQRLPDTPQPHHLPGDTRNKNWRMKELELRHSGFQSFGQDTT